MTESNVIARPFHGADGIMLSGPGKYNGFSLRETSGSAAATVLIYDGLSAGGTLLDAVQLSAGESAREWYGDAGIWAQVGVYIDVTGDVQGSIRAGR